MVVGLPLRGVRTPYGQSGSLRGLRLVPTKRRYLVPPQAGNARRWANISLLRLPITSLEAT
jgi:hypothetical protein